VDAINWYIIVSLILRIVTVGLLVFSVLPRQITEIKVNKGEYNFIARLLFTMVVIFVTVSLVPFTYQTTRIFSDPTFDLQNTASVMSNVGNLAFAFGWYLLYNYNYKRGSNDK